MRSVLITGFGPFPGMPRNPTAELARRLTDLPLPGLDGLRREALLLPTEWSAIPTLKARLTADPPDGLLMLGVAGRRRHFNVEVRAMNAARGLDAARSRPAPLLTPGGPAERHTTAAPQPLVHALRSAGLSATLSRDAGRYLCNGAYHAALETLAGRDVPVVFVHVPGRGPESARPPARTAVALSLLLRALMRP